MYKIKLRSLADDTAVVHIPRLLALTIPFLFVICVHVANLFVDVPQILLEPIIQIAILFTGAIVAVLGLGAGLFPVFALVLVVWGITFYYYLTYVVDVL